MNIKLVALLVLVICMTSTLAFAGQDFQHRNVFNKVTDWSSTIFKSSDEKQNIVDQRVERRAERRKADENYHERKRELSDNYKKELLAISNENISSERMAFKLKNAYSSHKMKLAELKNDYENSKLNNK